MEPKKYILLQVERAREQLRAAAFIRPGKNTLRLMGKRLGGFVADLGAVGKRPFELVDASAVDGEEPTYIDGDIVSADNAFADNDGVVWIGNSMFFRTPEGAVVTPDQFEYLKDRPLSSAQIFAEADGGASGVRSAWRSIARTAREARSDKSKEILYLTVGSLRWQTGSKKDRRYVESPLFMISVREEMTAKGIPKFKLASDSFKPNGVLKREFLKQTAVNIYENCDGDIPISGIESAIELVSQTVKTYADGAEADPDSFRLCILDSQNEAICQIVERNIDSIASARLAKLLSGGEYEHIPRENSPAPLYPLAADESQKRVLERVLDGESLYVSAPAGTGKSHVCALISANNAASGRTVGIMNEKMAANEAFLSIMSHIGLSDFCLLITNSMKPSDVLRQVKRIAGMPREYVQPSVARETCKRYNAAVAEYEKLNRDVYEPVSGLGLSLYDLIAAAVGADELKDDSGIKVSAKDYSEARIKLLELDSKLFSLIDDDEYKSYFWGGECEDAELASMLGGALGELAALGVELGGTVRSNCLKRAEAVAAVLAAMARRMALNVIGEAGLEEVGNRSVTAIYKNLLETTAEMRELYVAFVKQELTARIAEASDAELLSKLDKIKNSKVTLPELFKQYGEDILSLCPIVVTTPTAAANSLYGTGLDRLDTLIIDEASQMPIIAVLPFLDRIDQLVVFGDHMQLGITSLFMKKELEPDGDAAAVAGDRSVLQAVQGKLPGCELLYHYRSKTEMLIHISNETCYDRTLQVIPDVYTERAALPSYMGLELMRVNDPQVTKKGGNLSEAELIVRKTAELVSDEPDKTVGIITFNAIQQELILDLLEERSDIPVDENRVWVRSLENAQGKEADFILISIGHCRRNRDGKLHKGISELNKAGGENRLNVLFTRARCKNFIAVSFDYRELRDSENTGVKRLYRYLEYADLGRLNESHGGDAADFDRMLARRIAEKINGTDGKYAASERLGSANMSVDIAVREGGSAMYSFGFLLPSCGQTVRETVTKISVLENAGWRVMPVSPMYFLTSPRRFEAQLKRSVKSIPRLSRSRSVAFMTSLEPEKPFRFEELDAAGREGEIQLSAITDDDLAAMDLENIYRGVIRKELWDMCLTELNEASKAGDTEANLLLLIRLKKKIIDDGNKNKLISNVSRLYAVKHEKKAGFMFAQILRTTDVNANARLIRNLLREAYGMGIGDIEYA